jgi:hypothetical protein
MNIIFINYPNIELNLAAMVLTNILLIYLPFTLPGPETLTMNCKIAYA